MNKIFTSSVISVTLALSFTSCASRSNTSETKATTTTAITNTTPAIKTTVPSTTPKATTTTKATTKATTTTKSTTTTSATTMTTSTTPAVTTKAEVSATEATTTAVSTTTAETTTTTVVTKAKPVKKRVQLYVKNIQQVPELPMGCEAVSGSIALKWYGFKVDKFSLLPYQPMMEQPTKDGVWGDPNKVFVGNPRTYKWGCYSPVIKKAIEDYFESNKVTDYEVISLDGSDFVDLYKEIDAGNPIILWVTTWMKDLEKGESWKLEDGSTFVWTKHEHCVCLIGYDTQKDSVIISDPYDSRGTVEYPRAKVERVYKQLGNMALVIHEKESNGILEKLLNLSKR